MSGKVKFPEIADDADEYEANVSVKGNDAVSDMARNAVRKALPQFRESIHEFERLFRDK